MQKNQAAMAGFRRVMDRAIVQVRRNPQQAFEAYLKQVPEADRKIENDAFKLTLPYYAARQQLDVNRWQLFAEFAARLPAALLGLGCVMVTYWMGRRIFGPTAAFLSVVILATSVEYFVLSRVVVHDISLAFFITLALALFYLGYQNERHRRRLFLLGYAAMGFSVLAKGPVGVLLPVMIIGLFLIFKRQLRFLKQMQVGWGMLILFAVAAPWYILISLKDPEYVGYFFIKQNLGNFFAKEVRHPEPFYYYIPVPMGGMFPWSTFLPLALFRGVRARGMIYNDGTLFALIWFAVVFIFFSTASSKLGTYILPLFPAAALLVRALLHKAMHIVALQGNKLIVTNKKPD